MRCCERNTRGTRLNEIFNFQIYLYNITLYRITVIAIRRILKGINCKAYLTLYYYFYGIIMSEWRNQFRSSWLFENLLKYQQHFDKFHGRYIENCTYFFVLSLRAPSDRFRASRPFRPTQLYSVWLVNDDPFPRITPSIKHCSRIDQQLHCTAFVWLAHGERKETFTPRRNVTIDFSS